MLEVADAGTRSRQRLPEAVASEWLKLRTVRSTLVTLAVTFVLCVGLGALFSFARRTHLSPDPTRVSLQGFVFADISIGVIGVLIVTAEYSAGTMRATLAAVPHRQTVLLAKAIVLFVVTSLAGVAFAVVSFLVGQAILREHAPSATLTDPASLRAVLLAGLSLGLLALVAMGLGLLLRHTAGAIAVYVTFVFVLLLIVAALPSSWSDPIMKYLPEVLTEAMRTTKELEVSAFSPWTSTAVLAGYAVGFLALGGVRFVRHDA